MENVAQIPWFSHSGGGNHPEARILYCSLQFSRRTQLQLPTVVTDWRTQPILHPFPLLPSSLGVLEILSQIHPSHWILVSGTASGETQTKITSILQKFLLCPWNHTVNAQSAICLGSLTHSLNRSLFQKNVDGVPIWCKIRELCPEKIAENRHRSCPLEQPISQKSQVSHMYNFNFLVAKLKIEIKIKEPKAAKILWFQCLLKLRDPVTLSGSQPASSVP